MRQWITRGLIVLGLCTLCWVGTAAAGAPPPDLAAPEIDASATLSALTILGGSLAVLGERLRRK